MGSRQSKEADWVKSFVGAIEKRIQVAAISDVQLKIEPCCKLPYALEVLAYDDYEPVEKHVSSYETDMLVYEQLESGRWWPRVVIECKLGAVTTHDALTYSAKAATHKNVHPYLRYGVLLGGWGESALPARLMRHGTQFDFMAAWAGETPTAAELQRTVEVLRDEIEASRTLQALLTSRKRGVAKYRVLHRRLELHTR